MESLNDMVPESVEVRGGGTTAKYVRPSQERGSPMTLHLRDLVAFSGVLWVMLLTTAALAWLAGRSQVPPITVVPQGSQAFVTVQPSSAQVRMDAPKIELPPQPAPVVNVAPAQVSVNVPKAETPIVNLTAQVTVEKVEAQRTVLGPMPVTVPPEQDEFGKKLGAPKK